MNINKEIEKKLNLIIDRDLFNKLSIKDIRKFYNYKNNINIIINELSDIEYQWIKSNKTKNYNDFKKLIKEKIKMILLDREYAIKDLKYIKKYINFNWNKK
jgi:hypothetical protein